MITTTVFDQTLKAYNDGFSIIANRGSSRSSKTFSELQLIKLICEYDTKSINTVVSHSFPHLEGTAIRDFEKILEIDGINVDLIKSVKPRIYKLNSNIIEFIGFDNPGKALGASRKRLFIVEANKMPWSICHQLMIRTEEVTFLDWNPSVDFWFDTEKIEDQDNCAVIESNFMDNINPQTGKSNLTEKQLHDFEIAFQKACEEEKRGAKGYWWNWWQVYGLGKKGVLEGVIFPFWQPYKDLPVDVDLYKLFVVDWGGLDPTTLSEINIDGDNYRIYIKEHIYQPQILNSKLIEKIQELNPKGYPVICDSARKDKIYELQMAGIYAMGATKGAGSIIDGLEMMQEFSIFVYETSKNAQHEFQNYKRIKDEKTGNFLQIPEDKNNHIIDPIRYGVRWYRRNVKAN